jgi:hypothetical protein
MGVSLPWPECHVSGRGRYGAGMAEALPLRIFLASPGDLSEERMVISLCVDQHNRRRAGTDAAKFEVVGWESVRGTARRPQEAINELISECHYMITIFKSSWGSEPGSPWGYSSGTEEELFTGLLELGQADQPMRDVWVAFMRSDRPAPQIKTLRNQMSQRHALMYETLDDSVALEEKLTERLEGMGFHGRREGCSTGQFGPIVRQGRSARSHPENRG